MQLTKAQTSALSGLMRLLAETTGADALREACAIHMLKLLEADQYVSMLWNAASEQFERGTAMNVSTDSLRAWDEHYRFVDPLTLPMMAQRRPTLATQILGQAELVRTEFFNDFLKRERMHWGMNVYFFAGDECMGDMRIWRRRDRGNFGFEQLELLRMVEPAITATLVRLAPRLGAAHAVPKVAEPEQLLQAQTQLSKREAEVAWLATCGCTDKEIAQRLRLSFATVRFHMANAFRKMHVENRAALASRVQAIVGQQRAELAGQQANPGVQDLCLLSV